MTAALPFLALGLAPLWDLGRRGTRAAARRVDLGRRRDARRRVHDAAAAGVAQSAGARAAVARVSRRRSRSTRRRSCTTASTSGTCAAAAIRTPPGISASSPGSAACPACCRSPSSGWPRPFSCCSCDRPRADRRAAAVRQRRSEPALPRGHRRADAGRRGARDRHRHRRHAARAARSAGSARAASRSTRRSSRSRARGSAICRCSRSPASSCRSPTPRSISS